MHNDICFRAVIPPLRVRHFSSIASACILITSVELFPDCVSVPFLSNYFGLRLLNLSRRMCGSFIEARESVWEVMQIKQHHEETQIAGSTQTHPHPPTGLTYCRAYLRGFSVRAEQEDSLAHWSVWKVNRTTFITAMWIHSYSHRSNVVNKFVVCVCSSAGLPLFCSSCSQHVCVIKQRCNE